MPRVDYVFLDNKDNKGSPSLIEISSRANTTLENLHYCKEKTTHLRIEMHSLLKVLKLLSIFDMFDRKEILKELCALSKKQSNLQRSSDYYFMLAIKIMTENKVKRMIHNVQIKWTRHDTKNYNHMLNTLKKKRTERLSHQSALISTSTNFIVTMPPEDQCTLFCSISI